jgi:G:T-mismatch repair DNA endonuclease (very short patch repair protein)
MAHNATVTSNTKPERLTKDWLNANGIRYIFQYPIKRMVADFYLPEYNCVLEVFGDYWHANPNVFSDDELSPKQVRWRIKDVKRQCKLDELGYSFAKVWESDIYADADKALTDALAPYVTILPLGGRDTYNIGVEREHTREEVLALVSQFAGLN